MGPFSMLQRASRELGTQRKVLLPMFLFLVAVTTVEGVLTDISDFDSTIGSTIALLFLSVIVFRRMLGATDQAPPFFPYLGNSLLVGLILILTALPVIIGGGVLLYPVILNANSGLGVIVVVMSLAVPVLLVYMYLYARLYYCLPGVAIRRKPYGFIEGWRDSRGVAVSLVVATLIVTILVAVMGFVALSIYTLLAVTVLDGMAEVVASNVLIALFVSIWLVGLVMIQGVVYRDHTHRSIEETAEVFE